MARLRPPPSGRPVCSTARAHATKNHPAQAACQLQYAHQVSKYLHRRIGGQMNVRLIEVATNTGVPYSAVNESETVGTCGVACAKIRAVVMHPMDGQQRSPHLTSDTKLMTYVTHIHREQSASIAQSA